MKPLHQAIVDHLYSTGRAASLSTICAVLNEPSGKVEPALRTLRKDGLVVLTGHEKYRLENSVKTRMGKEAKQAELPPEPPATKPRPGPFTIKVLSDADIEKGIAKGRELARERAEKRRDDLTDPPGCRPKRSRDGLPNPETPETTTAHKAVPVANARTLPAGEAAPVVRSGGGLVDLTGDPGPTDAEIDAIESETAFPDTLYEGQLPAAPVDERRLSLDGLVGHTKGTVEVWAAVDGKPAQVVDGTVAALVVNVLTEDHPEYQEVADRIAAANLLDQFRKDADYTSEALRLWAESFAPIWLKAVNDAKVLMGGFLVDAMAKQQQQAEPVTTVELPSPAAFDTAKLAGAPEPSDEELLAVEAEDPPEQPVAFRPKCRSCKRFSALYPRVIAPEEWIGSCTLHGKVVEGSEQNSCHTDLAPTVEEPTDAEMYALEEEDVSKEPLVTPPVVFHIEGLDMGSCCTRPEYAIEHLDKLRLPTPPGLRELAKRDPIAQVSLMPTPSRKDFRIGFDPSQHGADATAYSLAANASFILDKAKRVCDLEREVRDAEARLTDIELDLAKAIAELRGSL